MNFTAMSDKAILDELGKRIQQERLNQNISQMALAQHAGVARNLVQMVESGRGCTLKSMMRILRALNKLDQLSMFLPEPGLSPVQLAKLKGRERHHAYGSRLSRKTEPN
ncbi:MAG: helix-turn-helix transcriptional regulator [Chlamydiota bacterium]